MKKVLKINTDGTMSLLCISCIDFSFPYARQLKDDKSFFCVWDDDSNSVEINSFATKLSGVPQRGAVYIVKSNIDITGDFDSSEYSSITLDDVTHFRKLRDELYETKS